LLDGGWISEAASGPTRAPVDTTICAQRAPREHERAGGATLTVAGGRVHWYYAGQLFDGAEALIERQTPC
jgi:hypothetical protein